MKDSSKRVLIVDDEPDHRLLLRVFFLKLWSLNVDLTEATNGEEAVSLIQQWRPHLILVDLSMSPMNGCDLVRQIRALEKIQYAQVNSPQHLYPKVQIILISADVSKSTRSSAFVAGCDDFVCKPYTPNELHQTVTKHLDIIDRSFQTINEPVCVA
jgi:two-component system sensor histidine kinase/response regulator